MTDTGQGLALKGADEVGGAQEDNTMVATQEGQALASANVYRLIGCVRGRSR